MKILALCISIITLASCGGSGSSGGDTGSVGGVVADGYLQGAKVCLDQNFDDSCDGEAVFAISQAGGKYTLILPDGIDGTEFPIVVEVPENATDEGEDPDSTHDDINVAAKFTLSTPPGKGAFISPLTTLINKIARDTSSVELKRVEDEIKQQLGIAGSSTDLYANFVTKSQQGSETSQYQALFRTAQLLARNFANTQAQLTSNTSASKTDIAKIASLKALDQLATISGIVSSNSDVFNADKLAAQNKPVWTDAVKDIKSAEDIAKLKNAAKLPKAYAVGVYQYVDEIASPPIDTPEARIAFLSSKEQFADWSIRLIDSTNDTVYTFVEDDIDTVLFARTQYLVFSQKISALLQGDYKFIAYPKTGTAEPIELAETNFTATNINPTPTLEAETGSSLYLRIEKRANSLGVSTPYAGAELNFGAFILDANNTILDFNGWHKGKNDFYFDVEHQHLAKKINVYGRDGDSWHNTNFVYKHIAKPLLLSASSAKVTFVRANNITLSVDDPNEKESKVTFNINLAGDKDVQILPLDSVVLALFDGANYLDKASCLQQQNDFSCTEPSIDTYLEAFAENGNDYSIHYYGIESNNPSTALPQGNYRISTTDTSGHKDISFAHLGSIDNSTTAAALKISQLSLDAFSDITKDGYIDAFITDTVEGYYYSVDFRIRYTRKSDGKSKTAFIGKTPRSPNGSAFYPTALLKSKVEARIATLIARGDTPQNIIVRLNVFDALRSENINNSWYTIYSDSGTDYFPELFN